MNVAFIVAFNALIVVLVAWDIVKNWKVMSRKGRTGELVLWCMLAALLVYGIHVYVSSVNI